MTAKEMTGRYPFSEHREHGLYSERNAAQAGAGRASSGYMYYYLRPGETTVFHRIDCDEYWSHNAGAEVELFVIGVGRTLKILRLGTTTGAEPTVLVEKGSVFAARLGRSAADGSFVTCITVPRYDPSGLRCFSREEILSLCPEAAVFWTEG